MTCYPEKRGGRLTGKWIAEATLTVLGHSTRLRERFESMQAGERWANHVKLTGERPTRPGAPTTVEGPTWGMAVEAAKQAGGPKGKWKAGRDGSIEQRLQWLTDYLGAGTALTDITTTRLDAMIAHLAKLPARVGSRMSPATINRYLSAVSAVLKFAVSRGLMKAKPELPWQREGDGRRTLWLSEADEDAICSALVAAGHPNSALLVRFLTVTGLRWGELWSMEPGQVEDDPSDPEFSWVRLWATKTNRPRSVALRRPLASQIRALIASQGVPKHTTFGTQLRKAIKSAGRNPSLCIHSLRHTTASRLAARGAGQAKIQEFLGHSSIKTTQRYTHLRSEDIAQLAKILAPTAGQSAPDTSAEIVNFPIRSTA